jgi:hypothetical protein
MIAMLLLLLSGVQPLERRNIPVAELNAPFVGFTCSKDGLPTVRMEHRGTRGVIHFGQYDQSSSVAFDLLDAVRSVTHEIEGGERRWIVAAEGVVQNPKGLATGTKATVELIVRLRETGDTSGDFTIRAGDFWRSERACMPMPLPTRMLERAQ